MKASKKAIDIASNVISVLIMITLLFWSFDIDFTLKHYGAAISTLYFIGHIKRYSAKNTDRIKGENHANNL